MSVDEILAEFLEEAGEMLEQLRTVLDEAGSGGRFRWADAYRSVHVIRGAAGFLAMPRVERIAAAGELLFGRLDSDAIEVSGACLDAGRRIHRALDELLDVVGQGGAEPQGDDTPLLEALHRVVGT